MSQDKSIPGSLRAFLRDGIEAAECSICREPFDNTHVVIQIKECGHHFGKECLEKWLKQKDSQGTCPTCRGILFTKKVKKLHVVQERTPTVPTPLNLPITPTRFNEYYKESYNAQQSSRSGFLSKLWSLILPQEGLGTAPLLPPKQAIIQAFEAGNTFSTDEHSYERDMLSPYVQRLRRHSTNPACPVIGLVQTLSKLFTICTRDFIPSDAVWRALFMFQAQSNDTPPDLTWSGLRDATWTLQEQHFDDRVTGEQWRSLYLFLWLMSIHRSCYLAHSRLFVNEVRAILRALNFGYPAVPGHTRDTNTRIFLSAAVHALERSKMDSGYGMDDRSRRLMSCNTSVAQLKKDVEEIWLEGMAKGEADIAAGYPEYWWTGT